MELLILPSHLPQYGSSTGPLLLSCRVLASSNLPRTCPGQVKSGWLGILLLQIFQSFPQLMIKAHSPKHPRGYSELWKMHTAWLAALEIQCHRHCVCSSKHYSYKILFVICFDSN